MRAPISLDTIASWVDIDLPHAPPVVVSGVADLHSATEHDLSVYCHGRWKAAAQSTRAAAVICKKEYQAHLPRSAVAVPCADPVRAWGIILRHFFPKPVVAPPPPGRHATAVVHDRARIHKSACIGPLVTIDEGAQVGPNAVISAGVHIGVDVIIGRRTTVMHRACILDGSRIGDSCWIGPNAVIGSYGFSIDQSGRRPHPGIVILGDRVSVGAQTCIDRASLGATKIGDDCHIDNLVQIAHNVQLGRGVIICGQVGIAGSAQVGDGVVIGGQAGIADHVSVAAGCRIAAQSGVTRSLTKPDDYSGHPAEPNRNRLRREARLRRLVDR